MTATRQLSLFEDQRLTLNDAIDLSLASLREYGARYRHWAVSFSGGKDSSATVTFVAWAVKTAQVPAPDSLMILYADTRMELPPLASTARRLLARLRADGFDARVVQPALDDRFFVYMFGRGVPPPHNTFRWCTGNLKIEPMARALQGLREAAGAKLLGITGVRLGESAARDRPNGRSARIALSCSKDSGECGQGYFQQTTPASIADMLAPLVHWRLCHVWDWLNFGPHGYAEVAAIADVYGEGDVRTGCAACNLIDHDGALGNLVKLPQWARLAPLLELKALYRELQQPANRKRKPAGERGASGKPVSNQNRLGPLTMAARRLGLARVRDIQARAGVDLVNTEEEARIHALIAANTWPAKWSGCEPTGDTPADRAALDDEGRLVVQRMLM